MSHKDRPANLSFTVNAINLTVYPGPRKPHLAMPTKARSVIGARLARFIRLVALPRNRLLHLTVGLCAILAIACMTVIAYGRTDPAPESLSQLGLMRCAEILCFHGIIPGRTSWSDAIAAFNGHSVIEGVPFFGRITLLPSSDGNSLESILIDHPLDQHILLGEIIALNGRPSCVDIYRQGNTLILHYPVLHVLAHFIDNQISPDTPVTLIVLWNPVTNSNRQPPLCNLARPDEINGQFSRRFWRGFASEQHYLSEN